MINIPRKLTHNEFMEKFYKQNSNADNIEVLEEYVNNYTKIKCRCKIDGYIWKPIPRSLLLGKGCLMCCGNIKKTTEQFKEELAEVNPNIEVLEEYINANTKIKCRCKIDGYEWKAKPNNLLKGSGCPMCGGVARKTHEQFIKELAEINPNIEVLGEYVNNYAKIKCRCKIDNYIWKPTPNSLLKGSGCPICNTSKGEKRILKYLNENNIEYIYQMFYSNLRGINDGLLSYDFYLPTYNLLIEYQGEYHNHTVSNQSDFDFAKQQEHDKRKREYAEKNNIQLLEIWYWDFDNIEKILENLSNTK